jgi:hypothetical protein
MISKTLLFVVAMFCSLQVFAQKDTLAKKDSAAKKVIDSQQSAPLDSTKQRDLIDLYNAFFHRKAAAQHDKSQKLNFSAVPSIGYTSSTGFALDVTGNVAFYTSSDHKENLSNIQNDLAYDTKSQILFLNKAEIWMPDNQYHFVTDIKLEKFPTTTYGIGTLTTNADADNIDYYYIRLYPTAYKTVVDNFYLGIGLNYDHYFDITESGLSNGMESGFKQYGEPSASTSVGANIAALYDDRKNQLNPLGGAFANVIYRQNFTFLGSNSQWGSLLIDLRKYFRVDPSSNNVLAFWAMGWFASGGTPYLNLPSTGQDMYGNTGRGYVEGRFRGNDMLYLESEYRFGITKNGLVGGVVFINGETFSEVHSSTFKNIEPGYGGGIRLKVNKHSDTNVCIDYGIGNGSSGVFVNLAEVF